MAWPRRPSLPLISRRVEAGGVGRHEEGGDALAAGVVGGAGEDQRDVGPGAVGDEHLGAVEHVVVAVAGRPGGEVAGVGAGAGLGEAEAAERSRGRDAGQPLLLLLLGRRSRGSTCRPARWRPRRCRAARSRRGRAPPCRGVGDVVAAEAAVLLGDGQPEEADLGHLRDDPEVDRLVAVPLLPVRHRLLLEEVAGERPEGALFFGQRQVHGQRLGACLPGQLGPGQRRLVHLVGAVGEAQRPDRGVRRGEGEVLGEPAGAVGLDGAVDDLLDDLGRRRS